MGGVLGAEDAPRYGLAIDAEPLDDLHPCQRHAAVGEDNLIPDVSGRLVIHIQGDRDGPRHTVREASGADDRVHVLPTHEAHERAQCAGCDVHGIVGRLATHLQSRALAAVLPEPRNGGGIGDPVDEHSSVGVG